MVSPPAATTTEAISTIGMTVVVAPTPANGNPNDDNAEKALIRKYEELGAEKLTKIKTVADAIVAVAFPGEARTVNERGKTVQQKRCYFCEGWLGMGNPQQNAGHIIRKKCIHAQFQRPQTDDIREKKQAITELLGKT